MEESMSERDRGPKPQGNIRDHLPELAAEGYHIAYCDHCREDPSQRHAAWKTLDESGWKVVLVGCGDCYLNEIRNAALAFGVLGVRG
jgi:hypothetical protein